MRAIPLRSKRGVTRVRGQHGVQHFVPLWVARHGARASRTRALRRIHRFAALLSGALLFAPLPWLR